jgi:hypothetical protein
MRRLEGITLTAALAVAAALAGCDEPASQVCADAQNRRVPDDNCAQASAYHGGAHWLYFGSGQSVPALGEQAVGGDTRASQGVSYSAAPEEGISRGGFGGTSDGFSEGGEGGEGHGGGGGE